MNRRSRFWFLIAAAVVLLPLRSPAPLMYVPGEGWYYEPYGETAKWQRTRAKDQLQVAEDAFAAKNYSTTLRAASRVLRVWPLSDYAPRAAYLLGRCQEVSGKDEAAFNSYQKIIEKYPKSDQYNEVLWRQFAIAGRFLNGEWFRLWNTIPLYTSMDETAKLYDKIVANGPYSEVAPHAQLNIGAGKGEKLRGRRQGLQHRRRPLQRPAARRRRRHVSRRRGVAETGRHRRIRPERGGAGHRRLHGFHGGFSGRPPRGCRRGRQNQAQGRTGARQL
jgi:tetratricopeptide (TPR) repeat protein